MRVLITTLLLVFAFAVNSYADDRPRASDEVQSMLAALIANPERPGRHTARDRYRHPLQTLAFMGIDPSETVVEIFPGGRGGWYRRIIEPLITDGGG